MLATVHGLQLSRRVSLLAEQLAIAPTAVHSLQLGCRCALLFRLNLRQVHSGAAVVVFGNSGFQIWVKVFHHLAFVLRLSS
jgi:hypothetical protein